MDNSPPRRRDAEEGEKGAADCWGGITLWRGDCLDLLPRVADGSVHLVLCDLPYGTTHCERDTRIDGARLWAEYRRVLAARGAVVLFGCGEFAHWLARIAPRGWFRYEWIWDKRGASGWLNARRLPMRAHENVLVFGRRIRYFPQGLKPCKRRYKKPSGSDVYHGSRKPYMQVKTGYPTTVLRIARAAGAAPAEKPVALMEYLIRTYTRRGDVVLDNAMGLGSTGIAAVRSGRQFIGMEIDEARYAEAVRRVEAARG